MTEPCKIGKCLKYPICIRKTRINGCPILGEHLIKCIDKLKPVGDCITPDHIENISISLRSIFPNLLSISLTIRDGLYITIDYRSNIYKRIFKDAYSHRVTTYAMNGTFKNHGKYISPNKPEISEHSYRGGLQLVFND